MSVSLALGLAACGSDAVTSSNTGGSAATRDAGKTDAGKADADSSTSSSKTDAGGSSSGSTSGDAGGGAEPDALTPVALDDCGASNPAGLSTSDVALLKAGGSAGSMKLLYPYDGTVFPRGLSAPTYMWEGGAGSAVYVRIDSTYFTYEGCLKTTASGRVELPQAVWDRAGEQTLGPTTPFKIELSTLDGKTVHGPLSQRVVIAQATLKGAVFYNSYNSKLAGGSGRLGGFGGGGSGAVLRLKPGQDAEYFARTGACTGCHSVSANGERMIARELQGTAQGQLYTLAPDTPANPAPTRAVDNAAFVGLSPDGAVYLTSATGNGVGPELNGGQGVPPRVSSGLFETDSGRAVSNSGIPTSAMMPTFSADGTLIAFNDWNQGGGRALSIMDYDASARKGSAARVLFQADDYVGWPFLLPDNGAAIVTLTSSMSFSGEGVGINGFTQRGPASDLSIIDVESKTATMLAKAMGFASVDDAASGKTYLPFGSEELHQNYYPTVSPVAAGGYFWVFFDSVRHYGNYGQQRALWGTAVSIQRGTGEFDTGQGPYTKDTSHPAFYLPGQELDAANHRAFTALNPCLADGQGCETGVDCCSGHCNDNVCGPADGCSKLGERCMADGDCCDATNVCINGYCSVVLL